MKKLTKHINFNRLSKEQKYIFISTKEIIYSSENLFSGMSVVLLNVTSHHFQFYEKEHHHPTRQIYLAFVSG